MLIIINYTKHSYFKNMKIDFREAKSIITKSNIPGVDFVINPYIGCNIGSVTCFCRVVCLVEGEYNPLLTCYIFLHINILSLALYVGSNVLP